MVVFVFDEDVYVDVVLFCGLGECDVGVICFDCEFG